MVQKTKQSIVFSVVCCLLFLLVGCGGQASQTEGEIETYTGVLATGSTGAQAYTIGAAISKIVGKQYPEVQITVQSSGGGKENMELICEKKADFGWLYQADAEAALNGLAEYAGKQERYKVLRGVLAYDYAALQITTRTETGIETIYDLKGKKVSIGAPGSSGATYIWPNILKNYGITEENTDFMYLTTENAAAALGDKIIDAMCILSSGQIAGISNLAMSQQVTLVSIPHNEDLEIVFENVPGMYKSFQKPDLYGKNQVQPESGPIETIGMAASIATRDDVSEEVIYKIVKAVFDNLTELHASTEQAKMITLEGCLEYQYLPLHPGVEKYFREIEVIK